MRSRVGDGHAQGGEGGTDGSDSTSSSNGDFLSVVRDIFREDGLAGFFTGTPAKVLQTLVQNFGAAARGGANCTATR